MSDTVQKDTVLFDFSDKPLEIFSANCAEDELWPVVQSVFEPGCSILEAGAGSGRWIKFLCDKGYRAQGIELNGRDVERFNNLYPDLKLDLGDVRQLPFEDLKFDAIMSLGVLEHLIDGPGSAPREMYRVLKRGGIVIFTVPHVNIMFILERIIDPIKYRLLGSNFIRSLFGKKLIHYTRRDELSRVTAIKKRVNPSLPVKYLYDSCIGTDFYEYRYSRVQAAKMISDAGLVVDEIRLLYNKDRIFQVFGQLVGSYDGQSPVRLNMFGKFIKSVLPKTWTAHMVLVVARRP